LGYREITNTYREDILARARVITREGMRTEPEKSGEDDEEPEVSEESGTPEMADDQKGGMEHDFSGTMKIPLENPDRRNTMARWKGQQNPNQKAEEKENTALR
jgi:hypothetical protein